MMRMVCLLVPGFLSGVVFGQEFCGSDVEDCYKPHETPGCFQPDCCELVCKDDIFCCTETWDETCVKLAEGLCGDVLCPNYGECDEFHPTPGCMDEECCKHIRVYDPFCAWGIWDEFCVREADSWCGLDLCEVVPPADAVLENESCLDRINDGCGMSEPAYLSLSCGQTLYGKCVTSIPRDTDWLRLAPFVETRYTLGFRPEFPGRLLLVQGECEGPFRTLDQVVVDPCGETEWELVLGPGTWYVIVDSGNQDLTLRTGSPCDEIDPKDPPKKDEEPPPSFYGLRYLLGLECEPLEVLPGDFSGDGAVDGQDLGLLFADWGPNPGSPADLNEDGIVDGEDLGLFFVNWTG
ncbi:MAG: hypothetical protein MK085_02840 [Phycisphaerales bacterium]|nr:hypothetical protein [Phycisphaerales bacterium]